MKREIKRFRYKDIKVKRQPMPFNASCTHPSKCVFADGLRENSKYTGACQACPESYCKEGAEGKDGHNFVQDTGIFALLFGWLYPRIDKKVERYYRLDLDK